MDKKLSNYNKQYHKWLDDPIIDEQTKQELRSIADDEREIEDRFYRNLSFGTAGLRGIIGAGTNRMNRYIVRRATQGYANVLLTNPATSKRGVAIAYDSRNQSAEFALEAALTLCANGIHCYLFETLHSVPQLSYAIGYYQTAGGIVITASHNPKEYNGYKVYGANGAQIDPDFAAKITLSIEGIQNFADVKSMERQKALDDGLLQMIGSEVDQSYITYTANLTLQSTNCNQNLRIVYTPLHGSGNIPVRQILKNRGFTNVFVVPGQEMPDPTFPTVSAPNPEAPDAFALAIPLANKQNADLLLATDPDSDRLGVTVRSGPNEFTSLTGNQIGCLLLHFILSHKKAQGCLKQDSFVVRSIVSTPLANAICQSFGVNCLEVLTGFRFVGEKIAEAEKTGKGNFIFGFEESFGYLTGTKVRDKDAICAAMFIAECASYYACKNMTLLEAMDALYQEFGYYLETVKSYTLYGKDGLDAIERTMQTLRTQPPAQISQADVQCIRDYQISKATYYPSGQARTIDLPTSNVLYFDLEDKSHICIRPSGTEPKLKFYISTVAQTEEQAIQKLDNYLQATDELLQRLLYQ